MTELKLCRIKKKKTFDRKVKVDDFQIGYLVLNWDAIFEDKGKHGKFDHLWQGPYEIFSLSGNNAYLLSDPDGKEVGSRHVNGRFLKHYLT